MNAEKYESLKSRRIQELESLLQTYQSQIQEWEQYLRQTELKRGI
jgi:uncharacterized damage-inducible protein DinB